MVKLRADGKCHLVRIKGGYRGMKKMKSGRVKFCVPPGRRRRKR